MFRKFAPDVTACLLALAIVYLSFFQSISVPGILGFAGDKISHVISYTCLGFCAFYRRENIVAVCVIALFILGCGGLIELFQGHYGRTGSVGDFSANALGIFFSWLLVLVFRALRQIIGAGLPRTEAQVEVCDQPGAAKNTQ